MKFRKPSAAACRQEAVKWGTAQDIAAPQSREMGHPSGYTPSLAVGRPIACNTCGSAGYATVQAAGV